MRLIYDEQSIGNLEQLLTNDITKLTLENVVIPLCPKIFQLNLTRLSLDSIGLVTLPKEIGSLTNLEELNIIDNPLNKVPDEIGQLTRLTFLGLAYNNLQKLPTSICNLSLRVLDISGNNLTQFPKRLGCGIQHLIVVGNPDQVLPAFSHAPVTIDGRICSKYFQKETLHDAWYEVEIAAINCSPKRNILGDINTLY